MAFPVANAKTVYTAPAGLSIKDFAFLENSSIMVVILSDFTAHYVDTATGLTEKVEACPKQP